MNAVNPDTPERLTKEELRAFPGCERYNDEECEEIIQSLYQIAMLLFDIADWKKANGVCNSGDTLPFNKDDDLNIAA